jgi:hypothetical protein
LRADDLGGGADGATGHVGIEHADVRALAIGRLDGAIGAVDFGHDVERAVGERHAQAGQRRAVRICEQHTNTVGRCNSH